MPPTVSTLHKCTLMRLGQHWVLTEKHDILASLDEARYIVARSLPPGSHNQAHKRWVARVQQASTKSSACNRQYMFIAAGGLAFQVRHFTMCASAARCKNATSFL
jgi:hypothetical protein